MTNKADAGANLTAREGHDSEGRFLHGFTPFYRYDRTPSYHELWLREKPARRGVVQKMAVRPPAGSEGGASGGGSAL